MIEASERTRSGCSKAIVWAIMPPIEAPTTWARSTPRWSSRPTASPAMSDSVYEAAFFERSASWRSDGTGRSRIAVERPTSRLSKRITK